MVKGFGMPRNFFTKFKITAISTRTTGTLTNNTFQANSLYDPFNAWFGTQPMGQDELASFYYRYKVNGCKIKMYVINKSTSQSVRCALYCDNVSGSTTTLDAAMQTTGAKWCYQAPAQAQGSTRVLKNYVKVKNRFQPQFNDADL